MGSVSNVIIWNLEQIKVELKTDVLINISENKQVCLSVNIRRGSGWNLKAFDSYTNHVRIVEYNQNN